MMMPRVSSQLYTQRSCLVVFEEIGWDIKDRTQVGLIDKYPDLYAIVLSLTSTIFKNLHIKVGEREQSQELRHLPCPQSTKS